VHAAVVGSTVARATAAAVFCAPLQSRSASTTRTTTASSPARSSSPCWTVCWAAAIRTRAWSRSECAPAQQGWPACTESTAAATGSARSAFVNGHSPRPSASTACACATGLDNGARARVLEVHAVWARNPSLFAPRPATLRRWFTTPCRSLTATATASWTSTSSRRCFRDRCTGRGFLALFALDVDLPLARLQTSAALAQRAAVRSGLALLWPDMLLCTLDRRALRPAGLGQQVHRQPLVTVGSPCKPLAARLSTSSGCKVSVARCAQRRLELRRVA
jgi:hypothetical protein